MSKKMWFGNVNHAQWVPMPKSGMERHVVQPVSSFALDNGGLWIDDSVGGYTAYEMEFPISDKGYEGIEAFQRYRNGEWGNASRNGADGYIRFVDPMYADQNLFNPAWATPGIAEDMGWPQINPGSFSYSSVTPNSYQPPLRSVTYTITASANTMPTAANGVFTFIIPPGHTLHLGGTGAVTGTGVVQVQRITTAGATSTVNITLAADSAAPDFPVTLSGDTYKAAKVYLARTSTASSTVRVTALRAQILPTGQTPSVDRHIPGYGHSGLKFSNESRIETYIHKRTGAKLIGASIALSEVEPWRPQS